MNMNDKDLTVGIIAAMKIEADGLIASMTEVCQTKISNINFYLGRLNRIKCVVAVSGIGKVFAAVCAQTMILNFKPAFIINTGVAGAISSEISIGDVVIAKNLVQHDVDTSALGDPVGMISGINKIYFPCDEKISEAIFNCANLFEDRKCIFGTVASGDKFICDKGDKKRISELFSADACEMEGAAIAHVCYINEIPFCVMRVISDGGDENASFDYNAFAISAANCGISVIKKFFLDFRNS